MTSLERIHAAAKGLPVDRVPVHIWLNAHTGCQLMTEYKPSKSRFWNMVARYLWKKFLEGGELKAGEIWRGAPLAFDVHTFNTANEYSLELGSDMIMAAHATPWRYAKFFRENGEIRIKDLFGVTRNIAGIYPDMLRPVINDIEDVKNYRFPDADDRRLYKIFKKYRKTYRHVSICAEVWGVQDFTATSMFGMEKFMMYLIDYPDEMKAFMHKWADLQIEVARHSVEAGADIVGILDDYGYDNSPLISMDMWKEFTYPELKRQVDAAHETGALVMLHSCGYQMPFLEHYVDAGIDIIQPFQPKAGNDFKAAYEEYGDKIAFMTGIDIQQGEMMTPKELKDDIINSYLTGKSKGRFMLGTTHEMQYTMPRENARAIFDTIKEIQSGQYDR